MITPSSDTDRLWESYLADKSEDVRNELLVRYLPLIRTMARNHIRCRPALSGYLDDMVSEAVLRLATYLPDYDADSCSPKAFVVNQTRWSFLNFHRENKGPGYVPESKMAKIRRRQNAALRLTAKIGYWPTLEEVAEEVGTVAAFVSHPRHVSLSDLDRDLSPSVAGIDTSSERLAELLKRVDIRASTIAVLYYQCNHTIREVAQIMRISPTNAHNILKAGLKTIAREYGSRDAAVNAIL